MVSYNVLQKKRDGLRLSAKEIESFVEAYVSDEIPDYIVSAFLMAIFVRGMDAEETYWLTRAMMNSGEVIEPESLEGYKIDKHSTGGVGDKVSLILVPLVAACGLRVPMISGRGLGHTGGTLDKLESIPGFKTELSRGEFTAQVNKIGAAIMSQSERFVPADMKLYALRDVTGTVESIPLITASILSKKLAEGADGLVMDIKVGSGAFMKSEVEAQELGECLMDIGRRMGKEVGALITDMSQPLGRAVGNAVEVKEAVAGLRGGGPPDLMELVCSLGEMMLVMAGEAEGPSDARKILKDCIESGRALDKFREIVGAQCGDVRYVDNPELLEVSSKKWIVRSPSSGYVQAIDTYKIGSICVQLGAGRGKIGEEIDRRVGLLIEKKVGSSVKKGEPLLEMMCDDAAKAEAVSGYLVSAYKIGRQKKKPPALIRKKIV